MSLPMNRGVADEVAATLAGVRRAAPRTAAAVTAASAVA
jgi:hypothetical protein